MAAKPKRKKQRGGQPGNTNALRHGFYSRKIHEFEVVDLSQVKGGLQGEIAMLRVSIRRVFERATELRDGFLKLSIPGSASYEKNSVLKQWPA